MTFASKPARSGQLLPSEVSLRSSRVFGRARNYPIFSFAWYRYRSLAMVTGALFIFAAVAAVLLAPSSNPAEPGFLVGDVVRALAISVFPTLVLILAGPFMASWVHSRGMEIGREIWLIVIALLLGVGMSIGSEVALRTWLQRPIVDPVTGDIVIPSIPSMKMRIYLTQTRPGQIHGFGMSEEMKEATRELQEANAGRAGSVEGHKLYQGRRVDEHMKSFTRQMNDPATPPKKRAELVEELQRMIATVNSQGGPLLPPDERQKRAVERVHALFQAEAAKHQIPAPVIDREVSARDGRVATFVLILGAIGMIFWLGGYTDLVAYVRQRDKLDDALQRQALEKAETARSAAEARLSVLAAQVEPHFLFNSLASVRSAIGSDPQRAAHIVDQLVNYLRSTIPQMRDDVSKAIVPLATQMDSVRSYLALMHERMPRLHFAVESEPGLDMAMVPPLMLISLVENAIKHGIEPKIGAGSITVAARTAGTETAPVLELSVTDDGVGFGDATSGGGIGLSNIQARLRSYFGPAATLSLKAPPGGGVAAVLVLPLSFEP